MSPLRTAWLLVVLAAGAACSRAPSDSGSPGASSARLEPGAPCSGDGECREGLVCDPSRRVCICTSNEACPGGLTCNPFSGRCVPEAAGCGRDADCGEGRYCDPARRTCRILRSFCEPCELDGDCGRGNRCLFEPGSDRRFCASACDGDPACPLAGTRCVSGQCVPETSCREVLPCEPDSEASCVEDEDCRDAERCDGAVCRARYSGCTAGEVCEPGSRTCVWSCSGGAACPAGFACDGAYCLPETACGEDADCPTPRTCRKAPGEAAGVCAIACAGDDACPLGSICTDEELRVVCRPGCRSSADCPLTERCDDATHACVRGGGACQIHDACGTCERCEAEACVPARELSVPGRRYCSPCSGDGLDPACGEGGLCLPLDPGNGGERHCAPPCPPDGCPKGFVCEAVLDSRGRKISDVCFPIDGACDTECT